MLKRYSGATASIEYMTTMMWQKQDANHDQQREPDEQDEPKSHAKSLEILHWQCLPLAVWSLITLGIVDICLVIIQLIVHVFHLKTRCMIERHVTN
jgi:hypothetical protein